MAQKIGHEPASSNMDKPYYYFCDVHRAQIDDAAVRVNLDDENATALPAAAEVNLPASALTSHRCAQS